ncbi:MAG: hypothetical protein ACOH1Q_00260 [Thiobacillus sp.]
MLLMTVDTYLNGPYVQVAAVCLAWPERAMSDALRMSAPAIWMLETAYVLKNHPCREAGVETRICAALGEALYGQATGVCHFGRIRYECLKILFWESFVRHTKALFGLMLAGFTASAFAIGPDMIASEAPAALNNLTVSIPTLFSSILGYPLAWSGDVSRTLDSSVLAEPNWMLMVAVIGLIYMKVSRSRHRM